jgi:hypothetical protein
MNPSHSPGIFRVWFLVRFSPVTSTPRRPAARQVQSHGYRLWVGGPLPRGSDAIALRRTVIVRKHMVERPSFDHLLRHELTHVEQWEVLGVAGFLRVYLGEYFSGRRRGLDHHQAYLAISLEREARERADAIEAPAPTVGYAEIAAAHRCIETLVSRFDDSLLRQPSKLPGWTMGHIIAHLTIDAEGRSHHDGEAVNALALVPAGQLRERFGHANQLCESGMLHSTTDTSRIAVRRLIELEVHAADLGHRSYTYQSWSDTLVDLALSELVPAAHTRLDQPIHLIDERGLHHFIGEATRLPALRVTRRSLAAWLLSRDQPSHLPEIAAWESSQ